MALSPPAGYTSSDLVFQDDFSGTTLDSTWHPYITSNAANGAPWNSNGAGGSGGGNTYDVEYDMPSQVSVNNGTLDITATQKSVVGDIRGSAVTFPVTSGAVSSYGNFEFTGGYLQISMKAPSGNGAWPGLWLLPGKGAGSSGDNFEIDMQEGGYTGSGPANQAFAAHLHTPSGTFGKQVDSGIDLTAGFNTYGIDWVPGKSITWYLNGKEMAQVTSAQMPIPTEPMEVIMDSQVANSNAAGWHTAFDSSSPASTQMQINGVQLYQLPGSGDQVTGANVSATTPPVTTPPVTTPPVTTPPVTTPPAIQPAVTQATASPGSGVEHVGDTVALTLGFNEAVTVTGKPTLTLNDGSTATYVSGSGTNTLIFHTTVTSTNTATSALAVTAVNLVSGASIKDASGLSASLSGAAKTFSGLQIDPTPVTTPPVTTPPVTTPPVTTPPVTTPPAIQPSVIKATASPGSGVAHVGDTIVLTFGFNEAVTVTGMPTATLNDGGTATYFSGSGTNALVFHTTVTSTNTATSALAVTGANLPSGASIKDASGLSANLSGTVTFSGLQIDPTPVTSGPPVTTPPVTTPPVTTPPVTTPPVASDPTAPVLSVADHSLSVHGRGGTVDLGLSVKSSDPDDAVSVNIKGLPRYETITDNLDHRTFSGKDITLTAAEVDSGLTLHSYYWGSGQPVATLAATATAKDPTTGAVTTSAAQTITVTDPPPATATSPSHADRSFALLNQHLAAGGQVNGQITTAVSQVSNWLNESLLTRPRH
jgi:beta-glucanase (GH16 family)